MEQKDLFEASVDRLPYVECSPNGKEGLKALVCVEEQINTYPTWVIKGRKYKGMLTLEQLAEYSGYTGIKK